MSSMQPGRGFASTARRVTVKSATLATETRDCEVPEPPRGVSRQGDAIRMPPCERARTRGMVSLH